jgi:hypothetical protein
MVPLAQAPQLLKNLLNKHKRFNVINNQTAEQSTAATITEQVAEAEPEPAPEEFLSVPSAAPL